MRSAFDKLISWTGLGMAAVLLVAGGLLTWASVFVGDQVNSQLSAQDITMPTSEAIDAQLESGRLSQEDADALYPFAGKEMVTGPAARAYADHYIQAHMNAGSYGLEATVSEMGVDTSAWELPLTYSSAGTVSSAIEADESLSDDVKAEATQAVSDFRMDTLFTGNTLRGLLLYGYAFATIGSIAGIAAVVCFVGAVALAILGVFGLRHAGKVAATEKAAA
ncbi:hypothetical protein [Serinibacter salmoneus]|uniref:Aromatic ring-opening dioxygenase LigA n=1 Tax=Serinibacter salmoneus TaxID=556530 RepID=A0A2A9CXM2_9MICO|nr:hypothetical protein [Serinibacter salmoneus]PFG18901.1 hypothetical protein ATL40_0451 [Serinibacter salmoneus]